MIMAFPTRCGRCGGRKWKMKRKFYGVYLCAPCDGEYLQDLQALEGERPCPSCEGETLVKRVVKESFFADTTRTVEDSLIIDECSSCGGVWLDAKKLRKIRDTARDDRYRRVFELLQGLAGR